MSVRRQEDEVAHAKAIVDRAEQAQVKAKKKVLLIAVASLRRELVKMRTAQKKLKKELCKEIKVKAKARAKRLSIPV